MIAGGLTVPGKDASRDSERRGSDVLFEWKPVHVPCVTCGAKMKLYCTDPHVRYFKCPTPGCEARITIKREPVTAEKKSKISYHA